MTLLFSLIAIGLALQTPAPTTHAHADDRAQHAMGFDQERTTHHFRIEAGGGTIEVTAKDAADQTSIDQIRIHLQHIAALFAKGDFSVPMLVHDQTPPGADEMKTRHEAMTFTFETVAAGGQVVIRTADSRARAALHEFLRFQIREHHTGDPLEPR
jgi:hypothetical protein